MSKRYYVNKNAQSEDYQEVHKEDCKHLPNIENPLNKYAAAKTSVSRYIRHLLVLKASRG